ncbi:MAG TPA: Hsp70 family protein [Polyangiaceae bacterium]|jgi:molecular chaperone DnaK
MGIAVGIDLGTTNTVVACVRDGRAVTLADEDGRRLIPSIVSFHPNGTVLVGEGARDRRLIDPANTVYSVKRLIGRSWASEEVQQARGRFPFELKEGAKNATLVVARGETYALPEMSAFVLRRAKAIAEKALGETVDRAVVTVPANFNDLQRASTKVAGKLAGLEVLRILNEPTAAALAYGQTTTQNERLAVYDLGGGTFDITLLDLSGNVFEVLATAGDTALGGDDFDLVIADIMADQIVRNHRFDPRVDVTEFARLRIYAEKLKQRLSSENEASIEIEDIGMGERGKALQISFKMTRDQLERETAGMIDRTLDVCRFAIETVNLTVGQIDRVIMVGGPTRMPLIQRRVQEFFGKPPALRVNPDEVVALGAAIQAHVLDRGRKKGPRVAPVVAMEAPGGEDSIPRISLGTSPGIAAAPVPAPQPPPAASAFQAPPPAAAAAPAAARPGPPPLQAPPPAPPPPAAPPLVPQRVVSLGPPMGMPEIDLELPKPGAAPAPAPPLPAPPAPPPPALRELSLPRGAPKLTFDEPPASRSPIQAFGEFVPPAPRQPEPASPQAVPDLQRPRSAVEAFAAAPVAPVAAPPPRMAAPLLIDVTPLSLRVETVGGYCDVLIAANTAVPCDRTRTFLTAADGQTTVIVRVAQGESNKFADNTFLGELELTGLTPAPRGETQIAVTFEIDADGILNVKAKDVKSARQTQARLQLLGAQTDPKDVEEMMERQGRHAVL